MLNKAALPAGPASTDAAVHQTCYTARQQAELCCLRCYYTSWRSTNCALIVNECAYPLERHYFTHNTETTTQPDRMMTRQAAALLQLAPPP